MNKNDTEASRSKTVSELSFLKSQLMIKGGFIASGDPSAA